MKTRFGLYEHYKGGWYFVLFVAHESTNERQPDSVVVYFSLAKRKFCARSLSQFEETVSLSDGNCLPRFKRIL